MTEQLSGEKIIVRSKSMDDYPDNTALITSDTGPFGKTMLMHLLELDVCKVKILSCDGAEQNALRNKLQDDGIEFRIGDIRDVSRIEQAVRGLDYVFHAVALKQVPLCGFFLMQAVMTYIVGSMNIIQDSTEHNASTVVYLSTAKAVFTGNAMIMSKAILKKTAFSQHKRASVSQIMCAYQGRLGACDFFENRLDSFRPNEWLGIDVV